MLALKKKEEKSHGQKGNGSYSLEGALEDYEERLFWKQQKRRSPERDEDEEENQSQSRSDKSHMSWNDYWSEDTQKRVPQINDHPNPFSQTEKSEEKKAKKVFD